MSLILLLVFSSFLRGDATPDQPTLTFEEFYKEGKREYTEKNWPDCVAFMIRAIEDYKYFEDELVGCRKKCLNAVEAPDNIQISQWYADAERALCMLRCKRDRFTEGRPDVNKMEIIFDFMERKPYEYLHICQWNMGNLAAAVQAAYTFLVQNPAHKNVLDSLKFYMEEKNYHDDMLIDAMRKEHETRFMSGVGAYNAEDWSRCIDEFDATVEKVLIEDERCRLLCMDKIDWSIVNGNPEIEVISTSMRNSILQCQHNCLHRLSMINGYNVGNPLAAVYEYVHYCQYKSMRGADAAKSVANYLLFDGNPQMRRNKHFYLQQYKKEELFVPDEKIVQFNKKRALEENFLKFVGEKFRYENNEYPPERADDRKKLIHEVDTQDHFPYSTITSLLSPEECQLLRTPLYNPLLSPLTKEVENRLKALWPTSKFDSLSCDREAREAQCSRAVILSTEASDCSEWLGTVHMGCAVVYCT